MLAALTNALRVVGKRLQDVAVVVSGVGAAGHAIIRLLHAQGAGVDHRLRPARRRPRRPAGAATSSAPGSPRTPTSSGAQGTLKEVLAGADVFIGVSAPNLLTGEDIATMAPDAIVFALANPDPEVDPVAASEHAAVVATGRSDYPNQINNVLAFPGFFRGLLDAGASRHHRRDDDRRRDRDRRRASATTSSTRPTSSPASSTPRWRRRSPRRSAAVAVPARRGDAGAAGPTATRDAG